VNQSSRKKPEWKVLVTLSEKYNREGNPHSGPAVQTTYSRGDNACFFSHTPGLISEGVFRPVQHLHDRHVEIYTLLLLDAATAVIAAKRIGMDKVESNLGAFRKSIRDGQQMQRTLEGFEQAARSLLVQEGVTKRPHPRHQKLESQKPTLKASLGDMMRAKSLS